MATKQIASIRRFIRKAAGHYGDDRESDRDLLRRFAEQRDEDAFAALVRRHGAMVRGVGLRVLHNYQDAEDVCQATFLLLARKVNAVPWRDSVANWLYGAAYHLALQARAVANRRNAHEIKVKPKLPPDALADITVRELQTVLDEELTRLPRKY
jgi:DNA-directed RNA polymerase specialized sigma24 family protein